MLDGPTLREAKGVSLRQVAKAAGRMSHGHLSKVEHGEPGRPVTPRILLGYERATGVPLTKEGVRVDPSGNPARVDGWRPGQLSPAGRRDYVARVGALALGGELPGDPVRALEPHRAALEADPPDPAALEAVAGTLETLGPAGGPLAYAVLRLTARHDGTNPATVARLARVAAAGAVATGHFDTARALDLIGLHAAVAADDPDLRAVALTGIAALFLRFDAPGDALAVVRLAEADERVGDVARKALAQVRAEVGEAERRVRDAIAGRRAGDDR